MSQRKKTAPSTLKHPRLLPSSRKGLIATEKTKKQSARKRTVLANRFHRTDRPLTGAAPPLASITDTSKPCEARGRGSAGPADGAASGAAGELGTDATYSGSKKNACRYATDATDNAKDNEKTIVSPKGKARNTGNETHKG